MAIAWVSFLSASIPGSAARFRVEIIRLTSGE
jgi:hypothetical protein